MTIGEEKVGRRWRPIVATVSVTLGPLLGVLLYLGHANQLLSPSKQRQYAHPVEVWGIVIYNGRLLHEECGYTDDDGKWVLDGYNRSWNLEGVLVRETIRVDEVVVSITAWNDDGTLRIETLFDPTPHDPTFNQLHWSEHGFPAYGTVRQYDHGRLTEEEKYFEGKRIN